MPARLMSVPTNAWCRPVLDAIDTILYRVKKRRQFPFSPALSFHLLASQSYASLVGYLELVELATTKDPLPIRRKCNHQV